MNEQALHVLIVDDEESVRTPLAERLQNIYKYRVDTAADGSAALRLLDEAQGSYDVALIDQVLEGEIGGLDLLKQIKSRYPDIQAIVFTGWGMEKEGVNVLRQGAYRYFAKPFNLEELALTIRFAAEERQTRQERQYMAALVKVGQGLTQTTQQDEQLRLAWEFVREQLDVSTFFIGLYLPAEKRIRFPLAYDEGQLTVLADTILGKSHREWGLAGYVVKTGEEILWSTHAESAQVHKARELTPVVVGKPSASGFCLPLKIGGQIQGVLSAQSYQSHVFTPVLQNALRALGSQLSVALENSRLFAAAERKAKDIEHQANSLAALQELAITINSSLELDEILTRTCKTAVEFFHADHSGLVLFDPDYSQGTVEAEYPNLNVRGLKIPLRGISVEEKLIQTGHPITIYDIHLEDSLGAVRDILLKLNIQSILFVPVIGKKGIIGSFSLDAIKQKRDFTSEEIALCKTFANQVAVAIENAVLFRKAETLREVALVLTSTLDQQEIFERILRELQKVVPYDSASVQLLKGDRLEIIGGRGFPNLPELLGFSFPLDGDNPNREVILRKAPFIVTDAPAVFKGFTQEPHIQAGIRGWLGVPMLVGDQPIGMFALDKREPGFYTNEHAELAQAFAAHAAIAIENARLYQDARQGREYLRSLYEASSAIISSHHPKHVLQNVVEIACSATGAQRAVVLLVDESDQPRILASTGFEHALDAATSIREAGISRQVLKSGQPRFIPDAETESEAVHPAMLAQGVKAAACLPLPLLGRNIGVLWIHFAEKHDFSETEKQALQLYANQSAIAYDNARRMRELEQLQNAAETMAQETEWKAILKQIAWSARDVLEADYTLIWPYDATRDIFFPEDLVAENVSDELLEEFRQVEPGVGRTTRKVLQEGYVIVEDLDMARGDFPPKPTRGFLGRLGVKSFQAIRLEVAGESLGVLYVDYKSPRGFGEEDRRILEHFANHASLTLKKARLYDQVQRSRQAAQIVARVSTLGNLQETLKAIVAGAREVLRCDIATLYTFDEENKRFVTCEGSGMRHQGSMRHPQEITRDSSLWRVVEMGEPFYRAAENAPEDPLLQGGFVRREGVLSALGIQLRFGEQGVGVMFINYRSSHRFTEDEIEDALQFGHQAAVAISNAQLFEEAERARERQELVASISQKATANLELVELLDTLYQELAQVLQATILPSTALWNEQERCLRLVESKIYDYKSKVIESEKGRECVQLGEGITGWVALHKEPQNVPNVDREPRYKRFVATTKSELAVPILYGQEEELVGVLDIESPEENAFSEEEFLLLQTLANQLAVAIRNAQLHDETNRRAEALRALYEAGKTIIGTLSLEETLEHITEQALVIIEPSGQQDGCFSHIALKEGDKLSFVAAYPKEMLVFLQQTFEIDLKTSSRVGIAGRVARAGRSQNVGDVGQDTDYIQASERTRSQLSVPLEIGKRIIGVLSIEHPKHNAFTSEDERNVGLLAAQAAVAIENARLFNAAEQRANNLDAVLQVSQTVISSLDLDHILTATCQAAVDLLEVDHSGLVLFDQDLATGKVYAEYPEIGITGVVFPLHGVPAEEQLIASKEPLMVPDVASEPGFEPVRDVLTKLGTCSILIVPILSKDRLLGSFGLDMMRHQRTFTREEIELCKIFAAEVAGAIENAQQHEELRRTLDELKQTKGLVSARTTLAWMGMATNHWRHIIEGHAINIRNIVTLLRRYLTRTSENKKLPRAVEENLARIEKLASKIEEKPITPPLSSEEGVQLTAIAPLVQERLQQLWHNEPYKSIHLLAKSQVEDSVVVWISPEWIRRALDILIDNAVEELQNAPRSQQVISVMTRQANDGVEIVVSDTGRGIPDKVRKQLFNKRVEKTGKSKGLGMGLLIAQAIAETYDGKIYCANTGPGGTTMVIWLPLKSQ